MVLPHQGPCTENTLILAEGDTKHNKIISVTMELFVNNRDHTDIYDCIKD